MKLIKVACGLILFLSTLSFALEYNEKQQILTISPQVALPIGIKIWFNESGGSVMGLTAWNDGEDFASLGIGHFLWHPYPSKRASFNSGFPHLLRYLESRGAKIPLWLQGANSRYCPWSNRREFMDAKNSRKMAELRIFLQQTIPLQAEYLNRNLQEILPDLLASTPSEDRWFICNKFYTLARTPAGIYALVDYLNFKGAGVTNSLHNYKHGSGLLQVLSGMKFAPSHYTPLQAYVWSAKNALARRVNNSTSKYYEQCLPGWYKRLNTYLEGDFENQRLAQATPQIHFH